MGLKGFDADFIKDIRKIKRLDFDSRRVLMVDDTPSKLSRNYGNAIYVSPYEGALCDTELLHLARYLNVIWDADNCRAIEKRVWKKRHMLHRA